jgi:hypothetical protein
MPYINGGLQLKNSCVYTSVYCMEVNGTSTNPYEHKPSMTQRNRSMTRKLAYLPPRRVFEGSPPAYTSASKHGEQHERNTRTSRSLAMNKPPTSSDETERTRASESASTARVAAPPTAGPRITRKSTREGTTVHEHTALAMFAFRWRRNTAGGRCRTGHCWPVDS